MIKHVALTGSLDLGRVVITSGAKNMCEEIGLNYIRLFMRHASGDFGTVGHFDDCTLTDDELENGAPATDDGLKLNSIAVRKNDGMILSIYEAQSHSSQRIWIVTMLAGDDTYTTILLPEEY